MWFFIFLGWYVVGFIVTWVIAIKYWEAEFNDSGFFDWFGTRFWAALIAMIWPIWAISYAIYNLTRRDDVPGR